MGIGRLASARPLGSSHVHNVPQPTVQVAVTGEMLDLHFPRPDLAGRGTTERGTVTDFSRRSQSRMRKMLASCDQAQLIRNAVFITLTYPGEFSSSPKVAKGHLSAFCKRLIRAYPGVAVVWKVELQERGAPHFHLVAIGQRFIPHQDIAAWWYEIVGSQDADHLAAGTEIRAPRNKKSLRSYLSKYISKGVQF